jgi:hypothetical protein
MAVTEEFCLPECNTVNVKFQSAVLFMISSVLYRYRSLFLTLVYAMVL